MSTGFESLGLSPFADSELYADVGILGYHMLVYRQAILPEFCNALMVEDAHRFSKTTMKLRFHASAFSTISSEEHTVLIACCHPLVHMQQQTVITTPITACCLPQSIGFRRVNSFED